MVESRGRMIAETSVKKVKEENTTIDLSNFSCKRTKYYFIKLQMLWKAWKQSILFLWMFLVTIFFFLGGIHYFTITAKIFLTVSHCICKSVDT